jgi:hypothetical protein
MLSLFLLAFNGYFFFFLEEEEEDGPLLQCKQTRKFPELPCRRLFISKTRDDYPFKVFLSFAGWVMILNLGLQGLSPVKIVISSPRQLR